MIIFLWRYLIFTGFTPKLSFSVDTMIAALIGALTTVVLALAGWGVRLESKTNVNKQQHEDLLKLIDAKFETAFVRFDTLDRRIERLERHVLNGHYNEDV